MAWEDDDSEEERGSLAVANDLVGSGNGATPRSVPDPVGGGSQPVDDTPPSGEGQAEPTESEYLGQSQEQSPDPPQQQSGGDASESDYADSQASDETGGAAPSEPDDEQSYLSAPIKAPTMPNFTPYVQSQGPAQMQAAKAAFDPSKFKPSAGRRALAGLAGFAAGAGSRNAGEGMNVAREITGAPLRRAQAVEAQKESAIQAQIDADKAQNETIHQTNQTEADKYNMAERDMRNQGYVENQRAQADQRKAMADRTAGQVRPESMAPDDPNNPMGSWHGVNNRGEVVKGLTVPDAYLKTPAGKVASNLAQLKQMKAAGIKLTPEQEAQVGSGGIIRPAARTNIHVPSAEQSKYNDWKTSFARENGRAPNAAEISSYGHQASGAMSKSLGDRIESQKNTQIAKAQQDFQNGLATKDEYLGRWQEAQDDYEQRLHDATGHDVPHVVIKDNVDENGVWHGKAPAQPQQAQQGQQPQQQRPAAPAQQQAPSANLTPDKDGLVTVKGPGFAMKMPPDAVKEGRTATDDRGRKWVIQNGEFHLKTATSPGR